MDVARKRAQNHFAASEIRDTTVKQMIEAERAATEAKTAKLRARRLAKEEEDRQAALAAPPPPAKSPEHGKLQRDNNASARISAGLGLSPKDQGSI